MDGWIDGYLRINTGSGGFLVEYDCIVDFIHNRKNGNYANFKVVT